MTAEHHTASALQIFFESNFLNFLVFAVLAVWLLGKKLPELLKQKNEEIESELRKSREKGRLAEEQLLLAEKELSLIRSNLDKMKQESQRKITALKDDLEAEKQEAINRLKLKHEREIQDLRLSVKKEIETKISFKSLEMAEELLKQEKNREAYNQAFFTETVAAINANPNLIQNSSKN
ncbi:MAG: ATP synthase F0 subunit B [Candidatus Caenarcaniphilales bacterium]|nr:ATP synthase F0 subunit B [Candidatus Caenarcaniphilales bacterium]